MHDYLAWAQKWTKAQNRKIYIQEAASVHPVSESDFDRDLWLLNLSNGTLDLRTRELRKHDPDDLITRLANVDYHPTASCPRWNSFIEEIMDPGEGHCTENEKADIRDEKAKLLQRYLGYCLSGDTSSEALLIMYGPTSRNGKSVCVEVVRAVLGDYARTAQAETVTITKHKDGSGPTEDIARLAGARMVSIAEIPQGMKLNTAVVKQLTGRDAVTARFLGQNSFEFAPQFKLLLHTNHLPQCSDLSIFDSGRVLVLPFSRHFEPWEQDPRLKDELRRPDNLSGVLNWLLDGLQEFMKRRLDPPAAVLSAIDAYRSDSDKLSRFVEDALKPVIDGEETTSAVYSVYQTWCRVNGVFPEGSQNFRRGLERINAGAVVRCRPRTGGEKTTLLRGYAIRPEYC